MARKVSVDVAGAAKAAPIFVILCEGQPRIRVLCGTAAFVHLFWVRALEKDGSHLPLGK